MLAPGGSVRVVLTLSTEPNNFAQAQGRVRGKRREPRRRWTGARSAPSVRVACLISRLLAVIHQFSRRRSTMSSHDRRSAGRRRAWGRGPIILKFDPLERREVLSGV